MKRAFVVGSRIAPMVLALLMGSGAASAERLPEQVPSSLRSLSAEEIRSLRDGEGMGLARAAELNGYPGPAHVLEAVRQGKMHLYAEQRQALERIHTAMKVEAQALGQQILALEALLEAGFRAGRMVEADLGRQVEDIGRKRAALRLTHLRAHLLTAGLMSAEQIEHYYQFRGFTTESPDRGHGH